MPIRSATSLCSIRKAASSGAPPRATTGTPCERVWAWATSSRNLRRWAARSKSRFSASASARRCSSIRRMIPRTRISRLRSAMSRQSFSGLSLLWGGFSHHRGWQKQWRKPLPKARYDAVIVGGGGHGLGAAYYLAKEHGLTNVAVLEKGWIGGGNTGRNTTIIRSNYLFNESAALYDHSVKMWETLSQELNYNVMFSPRGVMMLAHTIHDIQVFKRHVHANRCNGVDNEWLEPQQAKEFCPPLNIEDNIRYPVLGAALQRRGGTARHDAVAWGYARAGGALGA